MSGKIRVFCPSCKTILKVSTDYERNNTRFGCPCCGFNAPFSSYGKINFKDGAQNKFSDADATDVFEQTTDTTINTKNLTAHKGVLVRCRDNKTISLPMGHVSLGREILNPDDLYISRNHSAMEIIPSNGQVKHVYYDTSARNPTHINGVRLERGMKAVLCFGDKIRIGRTMFILQKQYDE